MKRFIQFIKNKIDDYRVQKYCNNLVKNMDWKQQRQIELNILFGRIERAE